MHKVCRSLPKSIICILKEQLIRTIKMAAAAPVSTGAQDSAANPLPVMNGDDKPPQLPKDTDAAELLPGANRKKKKKNQSPLAPNTVNVQILGAGANGAPASVYLFTDKARYLFNCGEGTQRLAHEHKAKLSRLEQIFLTRNTWTMMGGLPGLLLTMQDAGACELSLRGPPHLDNILQSMKRFVVLKSLQIQTEDCTNSEDFEDSVMRVRAVPLYSNRCDDMVLAYICWLKPRPGTIILEKCIERGIKPGPMLGQLKNGMTVTLENGTVVRPEDVSRNNEPLFVVLILDIPSEEYLPALEAHDSLFHGLTAGSQGVIVIVHFGPDSVLKNPNYKSFSERFSYTTSHIYPQTSRNQFSGYTASHRIQCQLNQLHPGVFPLLGETILLNEIEEMKKKIEKDDLIAEKEREGVNSMTTFHIRPMRGLDNTTAAKLNIEEYIAETKALHNFPNALADLKEKLQALPSIDNTNVYPKITFLGTGSCIPNKTRNVSAILLQPHASSSIILDCGEGTLGQIIRFFGPERAEQVMRDLKIIYISHLHADHHIGLIGLLLERRRLLGRDASRVILLAPRQIQPWLDFYNDRIEDLSDTYELRGNATLLQRPLELNCTEMGVHSIRTCMVRHCTHAFGVAMNLNGGDTDAPLIKITYSGDTRPCQDLIDLGQDSTVLIHEATMEDDLVEEARQKMHSTISQAIEQGRSMAAKYIILTHFSQRYAKLPRIRNVSTENMDESTLLAQPMPPEMENVSIAFDNMQVTLEDLPHFHLLYPALKALFAEHAEALEQKARMRELKSIRKRKMLATAESLD